MNLCEDSLGNRYYSTTIGVPPEVQVETVEILNRTLASTLDLWMQVKCSYWNVKGMHFMSLHALFDKVSNQLQDAADAIGERIAAIGGEALGISASVVASSQVPQYPDNLKCGADHVIALSRHFAVYGICLRNCLEIVEGLEEVGTIQLYRETIVATDQSLRYLEAHIQTLSDV